LIKKFGSLPELVLKVGERRGDLIEGERDLGDRDPSENCFFFELLNFFLCFGGFYRPHSSTSFDSSLENENECFLLCLPMFGTSLGRLAGAGSSVASITSCLTFRPSRSALIKI